MALYKPLSPRSLLLELSLKGLSGTFLALLLFLNFLEQGISFLQGSRVKSPQLHANPREVPSNYCKSFLLLFTIIL